MANDKKYLSKIVKGSDTLWIKDAEAQADIADIKSSITGGMHYLGKSTTAISDGAATGPWVIDGVTYLASGTPAEGQKLLAAGDIAIYQELEFIWSGASGKWQEFGSTGSLKALAFKDSASGSYTPAGTNGTSAVTFAEGAGSDFVTGYNNDGVAASFSEGAFDAGTLPSFSEGAFSAGTLPSFTEGAFTAASLSEGFYTAGSAPSFTEGTFSQGTLPSLGAATTGNFATEGETSTYDEANETLTFSDASTSSAVTAQGTFDAGSLPTKAADTWSAGSVTTLDLTKFNGGSKASDTWSAGTLPSKAADTWSAGTLPTKAADTFDAGSAATLAKAKALTAAVTGTAAAQTFSGTEATITVD